MIPDAENIPPREFSHGPRSPRSYSQYYEGTQEKLPQKERFFNKAWRNRPKGIPNAGNSLWVPEDDCSWSSARGARIQLANTELSTLSEPECIALQKVAQARLRQMDFQSHVTIPKDSRSARKSLKRALSWKTKNSGSSFFEKDKDGGVFAIPLHKAVTAQGSNDQTEQKKTQKNLSPSMSSPPSATSTSTLEAPNDSPTSRRHSSSSLSQNPQPSSVEQSSEESNNNEASTSKETPLETPSWKSRLIDALTLLSSSASTSFLLDKHGGLNPTQPQVPSIVLKAVEHLQLYGLHVLGIFRVGGSKKRMKQMRDQFDSGEKKEFTAEDNPHDVAALFKEYFRDLPEPLLTRDLYSAFLETQNFDNQNMQITALRLLCCLLPTPNRDTLKVLLDFLAEVASFAEDGADENGIEIPGNKMTLGNLAIIIGPNILHKVKGQHYDFLVEDKARADERKEIIDVVQDMIEHHNELFEVSAEMHHEALIHLLEGEPEIHDYIMKRLMRTNGTDVEDHIFPMEGVADEQTTRGRVQSAGAAERPLARVSSAPSTHPLADSNWRTRPHPGPHSVTRSGSDKGTYSPMIPTRSQSLNQEEGRHFFHGFNRQLSSPDDTLSPVAHNHNYRQNKRKTPPLTRSSCRYDGSSSCEPPPSPALSSRSPSWSNYSTPPSSPSGSTAFVSADSSSSSPITGRAYVTDEGSTIAELTSLLTEVEVELTHEGGEYPRRLQIDPETFTVPDWQLENWLQWETLTRQNSSQKDFLEQETLV